MNNDNRFQTRGGLDFSGTSMTIPVKGEAAGSGEVFSGSAKYNTSGTGWVDVISNHGVTASGPLRFETDSKGSGSVYCSDGRRGVYTFHLTADEGAGIGTGVIDEREIIFTFGNVG